MGDHPLPPKIHRSPLTSQARIRRWWAAARLPEAQAADFEAPVLEGEATKGKGRSTKGKGDGKGKKELTAEEKEKREFNKDMAA